jgi:hypothetical protein
MATTVISQGIALAVLVSAATISPGIQIEDLSPVSVGYPKIVTPADILPFKLTITNIGIEGYGQSNPPGIGVQVIGFSNYIL